MTARAPSDLAPERVEAALALAGAPLGRPLSVVEATGSTSDDARAAARGASPVATGAAFVAETQTAGRGRMGHAWHSPPGENLYVSFVLRPGLAASDLPPLALAAGLAVVDALAPRVARERLGIKWPNDVWIGDRKVAGGLVEALLAGSRVDAVVVGVGVNVRTTRFPPDLEARATSLALEGASDLDRAALLAALARALADRVDRFVAEGVAALARKVAPLDVLRGRSVTLDGARGVADGIDERGRLRVRGDDGVARTYAAGEVTLAGALDGG